MTVITPTEPDESERLRRALSKEQGPTDEQRDPTFGFGTRSFGFNENEDPTRVSFPFLRRIMRDHGVAMGLYYTESPLLRAQWYMSSDSAQASAFADNLIRPIYGSTASAILRFLWAGFSPAVKNTTTVNPTWTYMVEGEAKQVWDSTAVDALVYKPLKILAPEACRMTYDDAGRWSGIKWDDYYVGGGGFVVGGSKSPNIDLPHAFWATLGAETVDGDPYGFARCAYCAPIFHMYRYIWTLLAHAFENSADPGPEVSFPKDEQGVDDDDESNRAAALRIGRRKRSGSTIAIPSDVYEDYQSRTTNIPKWRINYSEVKTEFVALQNFLGYLETLKFRALMMSEQSLSEGQGGTSSRNVAAVMSSQRDSAQAALMDLVVSVIMDQLVRPAMAINMPWYQGTLEMKTIGFGKEDDDVVRQMFQLAGQTDMTELGIDWRRLTESRGFPMVDHAEHERMRQRMIAQADSTKAPVVEPTQGRRALVTQTGFGEMVYHQLGGRIDLSSRADGDFVASLPRTATWENRAVVDAARELRSHLADVVKRPGDVDQTLAVVDVQRCLYCAYDVALSATTRALSVESATREAAATDHIDRRARAIVAEALSEDRPDDAPECLAEEAVYDARNRAVADACLLGDVSVQVLDGPARGSVVASNKYTYVRAREVRPLPRAPESLEVRRERLDGEHLARYDEEAGVVLLSVDLDPEQEADFMVALGDRMATR